MKNTAFAVTLIICVVFSLLAFESQTIVLVRGNATFHIGEVEIVTPENRTYYSSTLTLSYHATFPVDAKHKWIVYSLDGGQNVTVYDDYSYFGSYNRSVTLSGLSSGSHVIYLYSKKGSYVWGTSLRGGLFDFADRVYFTIDLSGESSNPTPTIAPTSTPTPTPEPTIEPESFPTSLVIASSIPVAVILIGLSLLLYLIKRK